MLPLPEPSVDHRSRLARQALATTLATLSPKRRHVVVLAALGGLSADEIAPLAGMSVSAVEDVLDSATREVANRVVA